MSMKLGITVQEDLPIEVHKRLARDAEAAGMGSMWAADALGRDPFILCQIWADATKRMTVGTGIVQLLTRTPVQHAKAAATLQESTEGRFALGLGISTPAPMRQWHGVGFDRPLGATEDALVLISSILRGEVSQHDGAVLSSHGFQLQYTPRPEPPPIYLGAMGPRAVALAGRHADGLLLSWQSPAAIASLVRRARDAAEKAGRPMPAVASYVRFSVAATRDEAREALAKKFAFYWQFFSEKFVAQSPADSIVAVQRAYESGGAAALAEVVDDDILLRFGWYGTKSDDVSAFLRQFEDAGVEELIAAPLTLGDPLEAHHQVMAALS